jgi:hypothetical protein
MDAYLIELRSLGGLSGSPVFLHLSGPRSKKNSDKFFVIEPHAFYLLGLVNGHWNLDPATKEVISEDYQINNREKINTGIGIVVPAIKILETLNHPIVCQERGLIMQNYKDK